MALHIVLSFVALSRVCAISTNPCFGNHFRTLVKQIVEFFSVHPTCNFSCIYVYHNTPSNFSDAIPIMVEENLTRSLNFCTCLILLSPICNSPHRQFLLLTIIKSVFCQLMFSPSISALTIDLPDSRKDLQSLLLEFKRQPSPIPFILINFHIIFFNSYHFRARYLGEFGCNIS